MAGPHIQPHRPVADDVREGCIMTVEFDSFNFNSDTSRTGWASPNRFSARVQGGSQRGMTAENIRNGVSGQMDGLEIWTEAENLEVIAELKH